MKTKFVLAAIFTFVFATMAFAQTKAANYSGKWNLDVKKSKLTERQTIESMTMTVEQNDKDLNIASSVKRGEAPDANNNQQSGGLMNTGRMRGMFSGNEDQTYAYTLDGKEIVNDMTKAAAGKFTYKGAQEKDGKLKLIHTREFDSPNGPMKITTNETWSLSADGKTLTVNRETVTMRRMITSEMIFTKQ